jgi:hypothetical protein
VTMATTLGNLNAYLDNSLAFAEYLQKHGMDDALDKLGLRLQKKHKVVPHVRTHGFVETSSLMRPRSDFVYLWKRSPVLCLAFLQTTNGTST